MGGLRIIRVFMLLLLMSWCLAPAARAATFSFNDILVDAADRGKTKEILNLLERNYPVDARGDFGVTALSRAAFRGNEKIAKILIKAGANIDVADIGGATPLHLAAKNGHVNIVKLLIKYGAQLDPPDRERWTPLMRATMAKQTEVAQVLINAGADVARVNEVNETVLIHAAMVGAPEILAAILGSKYFSDIEDDQKIVALDIARERQHNSLENILNAIVGTKTEIGRKPVASVAIRGGGAEKESTLKSREVVPQTKPTVVPLVNEDPKGAPREATEVALQEVPKEKVKKAEIKVEEKAEIKDEVNEIKSDSKPLKKIEKAVEKVEPMPSPPTPTPIADRVVTPPPIQSPVSAPQAATGGAIVVPSKPIPVPFLRPIPQSLVPQKEEPKDPKIYPEFQGFEEPYSHNQSSGAHPLEARFGAANQDASKQPAAKAPQGKDVKGLPWLKEQAAYKSSLSDSKNLDNTFLLQLGAFGNKAVAVASWKKLQSENADVLGRLHSDILLAKLAYDNSQVYRLRAGYLGQRKEAEQSCVTLRNRHIECFVIEASAKQPVKSNQDRATQKTTQTMPQAMPSQAVVKKPQKQVSSPSPLATAPIQQATKPTRIYEPRRPSNHVPIAMPAQNFIPVPQLKPEGWMQGDFASQPIAPDVVINVAPQKTLQSLHALKSRSRQSVSDPEVIQQTQQALLDKQRQEFFAKRGVTAPQSSGPDSYDRFYEQAQMQPDIQKQPRPSIQMPVSPAKQISADAYRAARSAPQTPWVDLSDSGGSWVHIGNFRTELEAEDYWQRMFKYDQSFSHLNMMVMKAPQHVGMPTVVGIRVGPALGQEVGQICGIVQTSGMQCHAMGGGQPAAKQRVVQQNRQAQTPMPISEFVETVKPYWLHLGTFQSVNEAEYYWMFLQEDYAKLVRKLQYKAMPMEGSVSPESAIQLRAGPIDMGQDARRLCARIKKNNIPCLVVQ